LSFSNSQLNPYINYPFLSIEPLRSFITKAHEKGGFVKLYYTGRELTAAAPELWAMRAFKGELVV